MSLRIDIAANLSTFLMYHIKLFIIKKFLLLGDIHQDLCTSTWGILSQRITNIFELILLANLISFSIFLASLILNSSTNLYTGHNSLNPVTCCGLVPIALFGKYILFWYHFLQGNQCLNTTGIEICKFLLLTLFLKIVQ